jgi:mannose-6-phosphate isomerase-like protein (cupin superfamily)
MTNTATAASAAGMEELAAVRAGDGDHMFFLNHLASIKITAGDSPSGMSATIFTAPRGFGPPLHVHQEQDEMMYIISGDVRLTLGDETVDVTSGDMVSLPAGIPHIFQVVSEQAEMLTIAGGGGTWPGFDRFVAELGDTTDPDALPAPVEIDPGHVAQVAARHGIEILGPPPPPLD